MIGLICVVPVAKRMLPCSALRSGSWRTAVAIRERRAHQELLLRLGCHGPHGGQGLDPKRCADPCQSRRQLCQLLLDVPDAPARAALHALTVSRSVPIAHASKHNVCMQWRCTHTLPVAACHDTGSICYSGSSPHRCGSHWPCAPGWTVRSRKPCGSPR